MCKRESAEPETGRGDQEDPAYHDDLFIALLD